MIVFRRMTHKKVRGELGYWSQFKRDELVGRMGQYEDVLTEMPNGERLTTRCEGEGLAGITVAASIEDVLERLAQYEDIKQKVMEVMANDR